MEATFLVRRHLGQRPPDHRKIASFSRLWSPTPGNSGHDSWQVRPNSGEILGTDAIAPIDHVQDNLDLERWFRLVKGSKFTNTRA
jgi:hypothetical protein